MPFGRGSGMGSFRATGMKHYTGKRGRPAKIYVDSAGEHYVWRRGRQQWVSKWEARYHPKLKYDGSNWHRGANGTTWALRKVAIGGKCPYCRLVRWLNFAVKMVVHGGRGKGWTRSYHIPKRDVRRPLDRIPVLGRVPVVRCKCLPHWPGSAPALVPAPAR